MKEHPETLDARRKGLTRWRWKEIETRRMGEDKLTLVAYIAKKGWKASNNKTQERA